MKIPRVKFYYLNLFSFVCFLGLIFTSCSNTEISDILKLNCDHNFEFLDLKTTTDTRGNFTMKVPSTWKREMFVNSNETRLYFADTTRQLSETFIVDIGLNYSRLNLDSDFKDQLKNISLEDKNLEVVTQHEIVFKDKPGYIVQTKNNGMGFEKNCIEIYLKNQNNSHYILKIDVYGKQNINERFCEALQLIEYLDFR